LYYNIPPASTQYEWYLRVGGGFLSGRLVKYLNLVDAARAPIFDILVVARQLLELKVPDIQSVRKFGYFSSKQNPPGGIFEYKIHSQEEYASTQIFSQQGYFSTKIASRQGYFRTKIAGQQGYFSTKIASQQGLCSVQIFSQQGRFSTKQSAVPVQNNQPARMFQYKNVQHAGRFSTKMFSPYEA
jgi:hypothetical protein